MSLAVFLWNAAVLVVGAASFLRAVRARNDLVAGAWFATVVLTVMALVRDTLL